MKLHTSGLIGLLIVAAGSNGFAQLITVGGKTTVVYSEYTGSTSGVDLTIGGNTFATGTISYNLDASFHAQNYFTWDWDNKIASLQLHLLLDSPLIQSLGLAPVPIKINEQGSFTTVPIFDTQTHALVDPWNETVGMIGGGTVHGGLFDGVTFANLNDTTTTIINNPGTVTLNNGNELSVGPKVTVPVITNHKGTVNGMPTAGSGQGKLTGTPEPSTYGLFAAAALLAFVARKRILPAVKPYLGPVWIKLKSHTKQCGASMPLASTNSFQSTSE